MRRKEKIYLGRYRQKWEDNIKMDIERNGWECVDNLALDRNKKRYLL